MNKIRFGFFIAVVAWLGVAGGLHAQTSIQRITISLLAEYQANTFTTNASSALTNKFSKIEDVLLATGNVVKSIAVDLDGTGWTTWAGAELVREVNLTNGHEGIFLRKGAAQTNVSSFFGGSFSNNFTAGVSNSFPGATNSINGLTNNIIDGITNNAAPSFELVRGALLMTGPTNFTTNYVKSAGLYVISLNTTNIKFNLVGVGDGSVSTVAGCPVGSEVIGSAGAFYLNTTTNIFDTGSNAQYFTGPVRGTIAVGAPSFSSITGP